MEFICVTLMIIIGITDSTAGQYAVVGPVDPLLTVAGEDAILPCSLKPNTSAVNMRVEWFRVDLKGSIVHLYESHEDNNINQLQSYRGRTEVFKDELQKGNTSLKLSRVKLFDEGLYKCLIEYKSWSADITVDLRVEAIGSPPLITVDGFDGSGGLHLQCESKGWNPEPELVWLDSEGVTLTSENTDKQKETDGFRVKQMITVYNRDSKYHCRVIMRHHMMDTDIILSSKMFNSWRTSVVMISFAVIFSVITGILIAMFIYRHREIQRKKLSEDEKLKSEERRLKNECERLAMIEKGTVESLKSLLRKFAVNVTLDPDSAHPDLIVSDDGKQVRYEEQSGTVKDGDQKSNNKFNKRFCVLGKEGFTSGCFYYEVEVKGLNRWFVGVARESAERNGWIKLNPENGYWMAGLRGGGYQASEGSSSVSLSLSVAPQRVGVFVDYEEGRVSFYDVESMCHIYSFTDQSFNEKLYPVFWHSNSAPLIICDL
nr:butyrophilin subfamily 1 member A1-like [Misgurnus anguillicaudatus]XP_055050879.1 butyrophilin subfamily 1 member A1-like [Misgurnus anguillicaudatus]XP_055050880.1 butyrophilin subfamily 1 member A1-like [Misgurnus anguillicaudatus]